jgi:hypothetical protein
MLGLRCTPAPVSVRVAGPPPPPWNGGIAGGRASGCGGDDVACTSVGGDCTAVREGGRGSTPSAGELCVRWVAAARGGDGDAWKRGTLILAVDAARAVCTRDGGDVGGALPGRWGCGDSSRGRARVAASLAASATVDSWRRGPRGGVLAGDESGDMMGEEAGEAPVRAWGAEAWPSHEVLVRNGVGEPD